MEQNDDEGNSLSMFSSKKVKIASTTPEVSEPKKLTMKSAIQNNIDRCSSFSDLGLNEWVVKCANSMGITKPTPIQEHDYFLAGKNVIGVSETGSGKTAVFALPILQKLAVDPYGIYAIILTPTRELAIQIEDQMEAFGAPIHARVALVIGGESYSNQSEQLRLRPHVIIATPGRLLEHLRTADPPVVKRLGFLVLDECDRMMSGTLVSEVKEIVSLIQSRCVNSPHYLFTTATFNDSVRQAIREMGVTPQYEYFPDDSQNAITTVESLEEFYVLVPDHIKFVYFVYLMLHCLKKKEEEGEDEEEEDEEETKKRIMEKSSAIIFCNTCKTAQLLSELLRVFKVDNVCLHSLLDQRRRNASIGKFRNSVCSVMICTDVASRGLDIPQVDLVVNFDLPLEPYDYIHRVGRTARAGRYGTSVSLVSVNSIPKLQAIEELTGKKNEELKNVNENDVLMIMSKVNKSIRVAKQFLMENGFDERCQNRKDRKRTPENRKE